MRVTLLCLSPGPKSWGGRKGSGKITAVISCLLAKSLENLKGPTYFTQPFPGADQCGPCLHPISRLLLT